MSGAVSGSVCGAALAGGGGGGGVAWRRGGVRGMGGGGWGGGVRGWGVVIYYGLHAFVGSESGKAKVK